jgi:MscS family membrane protein
MPLDIPQALTGTGREVASDLKLGLQPHHLESIFWERLLPVLVVCFAATAAAAIGRAVALRQGKEAVLLPQTLRRVIRGSIQAIVYLGILAGAVILDRSLHGDPQGLDMTLKVGSAVALLWAGFLALDASLRHLHGRFLKQSRPVAVTLLPLMEKSGKTAWALLIGVVLLDNLGLDVKALLAGLGVGGLAVALAGQKTIENLFGGLVLVLDQPVRAGDVCKFGGQTGEVLEVGIRSVKLRTTDRTVITVPNGEFSQLVLENVARRDRICFTTTLNLRADTDSAKLRRILEAIEKVLAEDAEIDEGMARRVRFVNVGAFSLDAEVFCYYRRTDWEKFLLWRQSLLFRLLEAVESQGGGLAFPTQTIITENPGPAKP